MYKMRRKLKLRERNIHRRHLRANKKNNTLFSDREEATSKKKNRPRTCVVGPAETFFIHFYASNGTDDTRTRRDMIFRTTETISKMILFCGLSHFLWPFYLWQIIRLAIAVLVVINRMQTISVYF